MAYLILVRHGESEWNAKGLWTGWTDISLNKKGREEARRAGVALKEVAINIAYVSKLKRTQETLDEIKKVLNLQNLPTTEDKSLNERNYGIYTGKNKWQIQKEVGNEEFKQIRRAWDHPVPSGESLKQVYDRIVPYYTLHILRQLTDGKNVIIVSSGNPLRALVKYLEHIPDDKITELEIGTGEVYVYKVDEKGKIVSKEIRSINPKTGKQ